MVSYLLLVSMFHIRFLSSLSCREPDTDSGKAGAPDSQQNTEDMGVTRLVPVEVDLRYGRMSVFECKLVPNLR